MGIHMYILGNMPITSPLPSGSWLKGPLRSKVGSIQLAGALHNVPGLDFNSMRILGDYALIFIQSGNGTYADANGTRRAFEAGDAILVFPDLAHAYGPHAGESWEQVYIVFNGPQFDLLRQANILSPANPIWHLEPVDYWRRRLEELFPSPSLPRETDAIRAMGRFTHLLAEMAATSAEANQTPHETWLSESMRLLSEPTHRNWLSPQETAQRVGLSYENFRKLFAKRTGESPSKFQKHRRIEHACAAIYQGSHTLQQLADELGFCDVFHFSKVFTQITGEPPSAYRKKVNGG